MGSKPGAQLDKNNSSSGLELWTCSLVESLSSVNLVHHQCDYWGGENTIKPIAPYQRHYLEAAAYATGFDLTGWRNFQRHCVNNTHL